MKGTELIKGKPIKSFEEIGIGTTAIVRQIPETDLVLKLFKEWPSTEIGVSTKDEELVRYDTGLKELYSTLVRAKVPLLDKTDVVDIKCTADYQEGDYPCAIVMEGIDFGEEGVSEGVNHVLDENVLPNYMRAVARLHAHNIVISPQELARGRHAYNQAMNHLPLKKDGNFVLLDWTNLATIDQVLRFIVGTDLSDEEDNTMRQHLLIQDLSHAYGFRALIDCKMGEITKPICGKEIYREEFSKLEQDDSFINAYFLELERQNIF